VVCQLVTAAMPHRVMKHPSLDLKDILLIENALWTNDTHHPVAVPRNRMIESIPRLPLFLTFYLLILFGPTSHLVTQLVVPTLDQDTRAMVKVTDSQPRSVLAHIITRTTSIIYYRGRHKAR